MLLGLILSRTHGSEYGYCSVNPDPGPFGHRAVIQVVKFDFEHLGENFGLYSNEI